MEVIELQRGQKIYRTAPLRLYASDNCDRLEFMETNLVDWKGKYYALDRELAKVYAFNYVDQEIAIGIARLFEYEVETPFTIIVIKKRSFSVPGFAEKADAIKKYLHDHPYILGSDIIDIFNANEHLMTELNRRQFGLQCPRDTEGHNDIILGDKTASKLREIKKTIIVSTANGLAEYQRPDQIPSADRTCKVIHTFL